MIDIQMAAPGHACTSQPCPRVGRWIITGWRNGEAMMAWACSKHLSELRMAMEARCAAYGSRQAAAWAGYQLAVV